MGFWGRVGCHNNYDVAIHFSSGEGLVCTLHWCVLLMSYFLLQGGGGTKTKLQVRDPIVDEVKKVRLLMIGVSPRIK